MATVENNILIRCKNSDGDSLLMYPITKAANVDGLDTALAGKAAKSHTHAQSDITGLAGTLAGKAAKSHTHAQSDITGLADALAGKAAKSHTHAQSDITGLADALAGKANASHGTHVTFGTTAPLVAGTAAVGTATTVSRSDHVHPAQTTVSGNAGSATKLKTARTITTNLGSTSGANFDGSANVSPGVTGTLALAHGGTGATTADGARSNIGATKVFYSADEPTWNAGDVWFMIVT